MSLTADGFTVGAAFAIAVGSAIQAWQAYTVLDEKKVLDGKKLKFLRMPLMAIHLTPDQIKGMNAEQVKDTKRWLNWFLGWVFILVGALATLVGAALTLATDL